MNTMARTFPSTTLPTALSKDTNSFSLAALTSENVTLAKGHLLFAGREAMLVTGVDLAHLVVTVSRGYQGTAPRDIPAGATVWFGPAAYFTGARRKGAGDPDNEAVLPRIVLGAGGPALQDLKETSASHYEWYTHPDDYEPGPSDPTTSGEFLTANGARGVGSSFDDTDGVQAAVDNAYGHSHLVVPPPPVGGFYNITRTIEIPSITPSLMEMHIEGRGGIRQQFVWTGGNNDSVFQTTGLRNSKITGIRAELVGGQTGVDVFDIGTSAAAPSTGTIEFDRCDVDLGAGINNNAYRINHRVGGIQDGSQFHWHNGTIFGSGRAAGSTGIRVEGGNSLIFSGTNFGGSALDKFFTNEGGGGGCISFRDVSCSRNTLDFEYGASDTFAIANGRFEEGATLLYVLPGTTHASVSLDEVMAEAYGTIFTPGYALLNIDRPITLVLRNCRFPASNVTSTGKVVYLGGYNDGPTQTYGTLIVEGGGFPSADFYTSLTPSGGTIWKVYIRGAMVLDNLGRPTAKIPDILS